MRPVETLLTLTNLVTFCGLAIPLPHVVFWMRHLAPIALLIAIAQVLLEGVRWQMLPAYALTGIFFLLWLINLALAFYSVSSNKHTSLPLRFVYLVVLMARM